MRARATRRDFDWVGFRDLAACPSMRRSNRFAKRRFTAFEQLGCRVEKIDPDLPNLAEAHRTIVLCEMATGMEPPTRRMEKGDRPDDRQDHEEFRSLRPTRSGPRALGP